MGVTFQWTISLGQVLSTLVFVLIVVFVSKKYSVAQTRIIQLEREITELKTAIVKLRRLLKIDDGENG